MVHFLQRGDQFVAVVLAIGLPEHGGHELRRLEHFFEIEAHRQLRIGLQKSQVILMRQRNHAGLLRTGWCGGLARGRSDGADQS